MCRTGNLFFASSALLVSAALASGQPTAPPPGKTPQVVVKPVMLVVHLPASAELEIEGVRTRQKGEVRHFESPPVADGFKYVYSVKATWFEQGKPVVKERKVPVLAGEQAVVDLREPTDAPRTAVPKLVADARKADDKATGNKKDLDRQPDVIFVPTPQEVVDEMLKLAEVKKDDVLYDLGCGNGIIVVTAAKTYGCKCVGFDIDPERIKESLDNVKKNGVEKLVEIKREDIFTLDLSQANVITLYLLPDLNVKLIPQLEKMKPGSRIVSHDFDMRGVKPKKVVKVKPKGENQREHTIYLWTVPLEKE